MAWKTLCENVSLEEAVTAVANDLMEADRQREEWLAQQKAINQSVVTSQQSNSNDSLDTSRDK